MTNPLQRTVARPDIADALGIVELPSGDQKEIIEAFGGVALEAVIVAVLAALPGTKRDEFMVLAEKGDERLADFLETALPGYEGVARAAVAEEIRRFKAFNKNGIE